MKVVAIVQARMGSTRLPNKVMMDIHGSPMIEWVLRRTLAAKKIDETVVATTKNIKDNILASWCEESGYQVYRGNEEDVLARYYCCAVKSSADLIVRVTADDPLKDPFIIDEAVTKLITTQSDYCSNTIRPTYPEGLDIEVFRFDALRRAFEQASLKSEREHVTPYIWKHPELFAVTGLTLDRDLSSWRWTVDKPEDLDFIRALIDAAGKRYDVGFEELIAVIEKNPELRNLCTAKTIRNEGYLKSVTGEGIDL